MIDWKILQCMSLLAAALSLIGSPDALKLCEKCGPGVTRRMSPMLAEKQTFVVGIKGPSGVGMTVLS